MPDIDRTADIRVTAALGTVTAEIPLAGRASEDWLKLFDLLARGGQELHAEAKEREDRTWVIVRLPSDRADFHPESALDAAFALISEVNGREQQFQSGSSSFSHARLKSRPLSAGGGPGSNGSASPQLVLTRCLEGLFAQWVSLLVRRSAGVCGGPEVTVSSRC